MKTDGILRDIYEDCPKLVPENYEMAMTDSRCVPVSFNDQGLIDAVEAAHEQALSFVGSPVDDVVALLANDPKFVMGHYFAAVMNAKKRTHLRPTSPHNWQLPARPRRGMGDIANVEHAEVHPHSIIQN